MDWQPIETAPKHRRVLIAWDYLDEDPEIAFQNGQGVWCDDHGDEFTLPTHWMPLPAPPLKEGGARHE